MDWEFGVSRCKLSYTERINNMFPLYSTGYCIHYLVINIVKKKKKVSLINLLKEAKRHKTRIGKQNGQGKNLGIKYRS